MSGSVAEGMRRQLAERRRLLAGGDRPIGWKAGFGSPANLERFGLSGPLVGFMTDRSLVENTATVDISNWTRAVAEPELVVHIAEDISPHAGETGAAAAVAAVGPAIELADIHHPPDDLELALASNVFHRAVILGDADHARRGCDLTGLEAGVRLGGVEVGRTREIEELTGRIPTVLSHLARLLADHGEGIRRGDVVICGSIVPPVVLSPGDVFEFELAPIGTLSVATHH